MKWFNRTIIKHLLNKKKKNINVVCKIEKLVNMLIIIFKNEKSYTDIKSQNSNNK